MMETGCGGRLNWPTWCKRLVIVFLLIVGGCGAGEGEDDEDMMNGGAGLQPTLQSIQENIFSPICAQPGCHVGANAQQGLRLDSVENSFLNLLGNDMLGVPSMEIPDIRRVECSMRTGPQGPCSPDESYIIQKLEGSPNIVGAQMPLDQPPLASEQIAVIREWILNGALD